MTDSGMTHAVVWQNGNFTDLHATAGLDAAGRSVATAVNAAGQIVGGASFSNTYFHAAMWQGAAVQDLDGDTGNTGANQSMAFGINAQGQVVGVTNGLFGVTDFYDQGGTAFRWQATSPPTPGEFPILTLPGNEPLSPNGMMPVFGYRNTYGAANGINDQGVVVGRSGVEYLAIRSGNGSLEVADALMPLYGGMSVAYDINNLGMAVGIAHGTSFPRMYSTAFMWDGQQMTALDMRIATAINDQGQIIGHDFGNTSYLYDDGVLVDLATLVDPSAGTFAGKAMAISEGGIIVGQLANGHAFMLTPVPEPAAVWLTLSGLIGVAWAARRRRHTVA